MSKSVITATLAFFGLALSASLPTGAQQALDVAAPRVTQGAAACASISIAEERLACYDHLFGEATTRSDRLGRWRVSTSRGTRNDKGRVIIGLPVQASDDPRDLDETRLNLFAACRHGATALWFNFGRDIQNTGDDVSVRLTVDGKPVERAELTLSINRRSVGLFDNDAARTLLQQWQSGSVLELHLMPNREQAHSARFAIANLDTALKPLARACLWNDA